MFENKTYENLMEEALTIITDDIDKQEGSMIFNAIAPCIYKLSEYYIELDNFLDLVSGDTAIEDYLDRVVGDYGITRKKATYAVRKIETTGEVAIGTRWSSEDATYIITDLYATNIYIATCEQIGTIGNVYSGTIEPLDYVGTITATLTDILVSGEEIETDDKLRIRFYAQVQSVSTSGNVHDYRNWALDVSGCGDAKVFPLHNGNGTVKVLVVDENMEIDELLPSLVFEYIETVRPIGATVTVASPTGKTINVSANITLDGTVLLVDVVSAFTDSFNTYLKGTVFDTYTLSYAKIGSILLATGGIADYSNLVVNGGTSNITVSNTEMPISGIITLTEV